MIGSDTFYPADLALCFYPRKVCPVHLESPAAQCTNKALEITLLWTERLGII